MAKLINGNGNKAIWAAQDADLIASICGNVTGIAQVGNQYAATQEDANTIGLSDGVIITKEGRRIQLDTGAVDLFDIPTGTAGVTSYYIIGYHLMTNSDSSQTCETFVQKMDNATDVIAEDTFKSGATDVYVSCYRVTQDGLNIDTIEGLLPSLSNTSGGGAVSLIGSQSGAGSTTVSLDLSKHSKITCVSKKSGTIVECKEIPTAILNSSDVIPLGGSVGIIGTGRVVTAVPAVHPLGTSDYGDGQSIELIYYTSSSQNNICINGGWMGNNRCSGMRVDQTGLKADLTSNTNVSVTYNGSNSFTLTSISDYDVYLYA